MLDPEAMHRGRSGRETLGLAAAVLGVDRAGRLRSWTSWGWTRPRPASGSASTRWACGSAWPWAWPCSATPEVLILDEPANGLDPQGVHWIRVLLREFADRGGTVLLSSHLLHEVEAVADHLVIISDGRIQAQGTRAELMTEAGTIVEADDLAGLDAALHRAGLATHPADGDRRLVKAEPEVVARAAMADGVVLRRLAPAEDAGLERLFFKLTTPDANTPSTQTDSIHPELAGATA